MAMKWSDAFDKGGKSITGYQIYDGSEQELKFDSSSVSTESTEDNGIVVNAGGRRLFERQESVRTVKRRLAQSTITEKQ